MKEYVDYYALRADWIRWHNEVATNDERGLYYLVCDLSEKYFSEFRFEPHTIADDFSKRQEQNDDGTWTTVYNDAPDILQFFADVVLTSYRYRVAPLDESTLGQVDYKNRVMTIPPSVLNSDACTPTLLHETIHIYEEALDNLPGYYREALLLCLYKDLRGKIPDLDDRIISFTHPIVGEQIMFRGGVHGILFLLKSFDLDLKCGYDLGTVCGYGQDEHDDEQDMNDRETADGD